jgi:hypothetical protein
VGPMAGLEGADNLVSTGILSPDRPVSSGSVYRLSYPGPYRQCNRYYRGVYWRQRREGSAVCDGLPSTHMPMYC